MNDSGSAPAKTAKSKPETKVEKVAMKDGREVDFAGKRKMLKSVNTGADGTQTLHIDFRNGESRDIKLNPALTAQYAAHGAEQKFGDEVAGLKAEGGGEADIDDMVLAIDELAERHAKGEWNSRSEGAGVSGTSVLLKALMEHANNLGKPKTVEDTKAFLKTRSHNEKMALRESAVLKPIVERLESEKNAKVKNIDTTALLAGFEDGTAPVAEAPAA